MKKAFEDFWLGFTTVMKRVFAGIDFPSWKAWGAMAAVVVLMLIALAIILGIVCGVSWGVVALTG